MNTSVLYYSFSREQLTGLYAASEKERFSYYWVVLDDPSTIQKGPTCYDWIMEDSFHVHLHPVFYAIVNSATYTL